MLAVLRALKFKLTHLFSSLSIIFIFFFQSPTPRYRWVKIDEVGTVKNIVQTEDVKLGNFNHTLTIKNVKKTHNGTYGCIATINDTNRIKQDIMQGRIIVRGIHCLNEFSNFLSCFL